MLDSNTRDHAEQDDTSRMNDIQICLECGAVWPAGSTCQEHFHQMLYWEHEYPEYGVVHHLMVLCYYLQHPHLYSPDGLRAALQLLADFVAHGMTPQAIRRRDSEKVSSSRRTFKIKGTAAAHGTYAQPVTWPMTAADVVAAGADHYCESVRHWAQSVYDALEESGNLAQS